MPKFVLKEMECLYLEELRTCINTLMANLESLPVAKGAEGRLGFQKLKRYNHKWVLISLFLGALYLSRRSKSLTLSLSLSLHDANRMFTALSSRVIVEKMPCSSLQRFNERYHAFCVSFSYPVSLFWCKWCIPCLLRLQSTSFVSLEAGTLSL